MDILDILDFLSDLEDDVKESVGRKLLGSQKYEKMQEKKREKSEKRLEKLRSNMSERYEENKKRREEEKQKEAESARAFAKKTERRYRALGIELDLEGLSFLEIMDEIEKANAILDQEDEELDRELDKLLDD